MPATKQKIRLLLTGGGTGGHIYPVLAIREILSQELDISDVLYVGAKGRVEESIVPRFDMPHRFIDSAPVAGVNPLRLASGIGKVLAGTLQAAAILLRFRPHLVVASGGYVSAPVCMAMFLLRPLLKAPLVIHEQNVVPGLMNKTASLFADVVLVSFPETPYFLWNNRCVYTGYPVPAAKVRTADRLAARSKLGIPQNRMLMLAYGGSVGSRSINRLLASILPRHFAERKDLIVVHSTGLATGEYHAWHDTLDVLKASCAPTTSIETGDQIAEVRMNGDGLIYRLHPYLHDIADWLAAADLVVCRAGAGALAEICSVGRAAILIPKRGLPGDHQEHNAIHLAEMQGCEVVFERPGQNGVDFIDPGEFLPVLNALLDNPERRHSLEIGARAGFYPKFRERILQAIRGVHERSPLDYVSSIVEPSNVSILKQVDLLVDFLRKQPPESFFRRLYSIKMEHCLASEKWQEVNVGIKLAGALGKVDRIPELARLFRSGNGFMRRNVLRAMEHMNVFQEETAQLVAQGLQDRYFEVRAMAISLAGKYAAQLSGRPGFAEQIRQALTRRFENFDVRREALLVLPHFLPVEGYFRVADRYRFTENARLRQAILDGLRSAINSSCIAPGDLDATRRFVEEMPVTTSDFNPRFLIRESFLRFYRALEEAGSRLEKEAVLDRKSH